MGGVFDMELALQVGGTFAQYYMPLSLLSLPPPVMKKIIATLSPHLHLMIPF
jgi:hypothetical protein